MVPVFAEGPFGFGADAAGIAVWFGGAELDGLGAVAELVGGAGVVSCFACAVAGVDAPFCDIVGVHATIAPATTAISVAKRRGCGRSISQLLRNGEVERHGHVAKPRIAQNVCAVHAGAAPKAGGPDGAVR
jgi:hypothetical protein